MDNNQFDNNQMNQQMDPQMNPQMYQQENQVSNQSGLPNTALPFNGDTKSFRAKIENMQSVSLGGAPLQGEDITENLKSAKTKTVQQVNKKKHTGLIAAIIAIVVLLAGGISAYFMFLTPEKRYERAMDKADAAFAAGNYDAAASNYKKALSIYDDDIDAIYGALTADMGLQNEKTLENDYKAYSKILKSIDKSKIQEKKKEVVMIFQMSEIIYADNDEQVIDELEAGLSLVGEDDLLWDDWACAKLNVANSLEEENQEAALKVYSEVLDKRPDNEAAISDFTSCWTSIVDAYLEDYLYEQAQELLDTYKGKVSTINFTDYQSKITYAKTIAEQGTAILQRAYEAMQTGDYNTMCEIDLGDELDNFLTYVNGHLIWTPDGFVDDYTGVAIGLYKFTDVGDVRQNYFYYGDYVDGVRCGQAVCFYGIDLDTYEYELFEGAWDEDRPNGYGACGDYHAYNEAYDEYTNTVESGNFIDGYADGEMSAYVESSEGYKVEGTFQANMGEVTDVRDQYPQYDFNVDESRNIYVVMETEEVTWWLSLNKKSKIRAASWFEFF